MSDLNNIFSQSNCLSKAQLVGYIQQKLDREEVYLVESHLNDCPFCSDAIEGLMNTDLSKMESDLKEIKPKILHDVVKNIPTEKVETQPTPLKVSSNRNKWLVAASVLLLMGLGGFSVYSYMHNQQHDLAMNEETSYSKKEEKYTEAAAPANSEIVTLSVPEDSILKLDEKKVSVKESKKAPIENAKMEAKKEVVFTPSVLKKEEETKAIDDKLIKSEPLIESQDFHDGYSQSENKIAMQEKVAVQESEKVIQTKKSSIGMSKNNNAPIVSYPQSNQMNYPSNDNNNNINIAQSKYKEELSSFDIAMNYYNNGDYKNAITYFEKALKNAPKKQVDEILYQLAQAYYKNKDYKKAEEMFALLKNSKKFKNASEEQLQKTKK